VIKGIDFEGVTEWRKEQAFEDHLNFLTYTRLYSKVLEDNEEKI
jgi:hypothetical protein